MAPAIGQTAQQALWTGCRLASATLLGALLVLLRPPELHAQVLLHPRGELLQRQGVWDHLAAISARRSLLVHHPEGERQPSWVRVSQSFSIALVGEDVNDVPRGSSWSAPRRLLLDQVRAHTQLDPYRSSTRDPATGAGVVLGIVDSGVDIAHPDLLHGDGSTRVLWWLDFGLSPLGLYPELEEDFGCEELGCGILGKPELDTIVAGHRVESQAGDPISLPSDQLGHGTHVASVAAGNGASNPDYTGIAPDAELIVARVAENDAVVNDLDILLSARFVFERAEELGRPAVVNLSLGGDFGPHNGQSGIARALTELVEQAPGRVIVVAAGNSAAFTELDVAYPAPYGIHTQVHVPEGVKVRVPILTPDTPTRNAGLFVWIDSATSDDLRVGLEDHHGATIHKPLRRGEQRLVSDGKSEIALIHHVDTEDGVDASERGIALLATGELASNSVYAITLEGHGTAELWLQSEGGWGPGLGPPALFPGAMREGTITVPADSPALIAVGATLNRTHWPSTEGGEVELQPFADELSFEPNSTGFFSSRGPNSDGALKPDLVAPGIAVIGAMAASARPVTDHRVNRNSMFYESPLCAGVGSFSEDAQCAVVDGFHGVAVGTSMAAPVVSGACALLLQKDPSLSFDQVRHLLQSGASSLLDGGAQSGAGLLNARSSLRALAADGPADAPSARNSRMVFSDVVAHPDPERTVQVLGQLRDESGLPISTSQLRDIQVRVRHGRVQHRNGDTPGLLVLQVAADADSGGQTLGVELADGQRLLRRGSIPIGVDRNVIRHVIATRGGCQLLRSGSRPPASNALWLLLTLAAGATRRRSGRLLKCLAPANYSKRAR